MRHAAYLSTSRHGIYYFRWPIPSYMHPQGKRTDVKVSIGTRSPQAARQLSRLLMLSGQSAVLEASLQPMRYDEIRAHVREHFRATLRNFKDGVAQDGPAQSAQLNGLVVGAGLAEGDPEEWADLAHPDGASGLLRAFCDLRGISEEMTPEDRRLMLIELHKGYRAHVVEALAHNSTFERMDLEDVPALTPAPCAPRPYGAGTGQFSKVPPYEEVVQQYFAEMTSAASLAPKTESEKRDALALLGEIIGHKPVSLITKADARTVKSALLRLPKNRSKLPRTRDLSIVQLLELEGVERIAARTVNAYVSSMQTFFSWCVSNGHADENVFSGIRVKLPQKTT